MSLILSRYECAECGKRHANGSKAQARCEQQSLIVRTSHSHLGMDCRECRLWPAWTDARCPVCGQSPKQRGEDMRRMARARRRLGNQGGGR